jgi:hypothetical protein
MPMPTRSALPLPRHLLHRQPSPAHRLPRPAVDRAYRPPDDPDRVVLQGEVDGATIPAAPKAAPAKTIPAEPKLTPVPETGRGASRFIPGPDRKAWCSQCDRRVSAGELASCKDRFCAFQRNS